MGLGSLSVECYSNLNEIETGNMIALGIIGALLLLTLFGTCVDLVIRSRFLESIVEKSVYDNIYYNLSYIDYRDNGEDESMLQSDSVSHTSYSYIPKSKWILSLRNSSTNSTEREKEDVMLDFANEPFETPQNQKIALAVLKVFIAWSIVSNYKSIFDDKRASNTTNMRFSFLNGLRVLSMVWIIFGSFFLLILL